MSDRTTLSGVANLRKASKAFVIILGAIKSNELLNTLSESYSRCYVVVKAPPVDAQHKVAMDDRRAFIEQYRKIGFREQLVDRPDEVLDEVLTHNLQLEIGVDTLLVLDLQRWARRRGR